jgi:flagellar secretion chaperone FliS
MYAQDYARTYRANSVLTASPGQLVLLLFDAALNSLAIARQACDEAVADPRRLEVVHTNLVKAQ